MKPRIALLTNFYSSLNAGDQALLAINVEQIRAAVDPQQLLLVCGWPGEAYFGQLGVIPLASPFNLVGLADGVPAWIQMVNLLRGIACLRLYRSGHSMRIPGGWKNLFTAYQNADLVASVSGTHFYSTGRFGWPFPLQILMLRLAVEFDKPLYILPQSIGPLKRKWEAAWVRSSFLPAQTIFLRDQYSLQLADSLNLNMQRVRYCPDPAFRFQASERQRALEILYRYGYSGSHQAVGLTIIPWQGKWQDPETIRRYFSALEGLGKKMYQTYGVKTYLFNQVVGPTLYNDDRVAVRQFLRQMKETPDWLVYVDENLSAADLKACYGCMGMVVATRMHAGIFAMAMHVPVLFLGYISKTRGLARSFGLEDWVIDLEQLDAHVLWDKAEMLWNKRDEWSVHLAGLMETVASQVLDAAEVIRSDYETSAQ